MTQSSGLNEISLLLQIKERTVRVESQRVNQKVCECQFVVTVFVLTDMFNVLLLLLCSS